MQHVFLREDRAWSSLQPPYTGPHLLLRRNDKTITLSIVDAERRVSLDRVKPAFIEVSQEQPRSLAGIQHPRTGKLRRRVTFTIADLLSS